MDVTIPILQMKNLSFKEMRLLIQGHTEVWNPYPSGSSVRAISTLLHWALTKGNMQT